MESGDVGRAPGEMKDWFVGELRCIVGLPETSTRNEVYLERLGIGRAEDGDICSE